MKVTGNLLFTIFLGIFNLQQFVYGRELPRYLELCKRKQPKQAIEQCMVRNIEILRPKLAKGVPDLLLPPVDPLIIPEACLNSGNFHACFRQLEFYHGQLFQLKSINLDLDKFTLDLSIRFPKLRIKSIYEIKGRILVLELNGKGPADGNYTNVDLALAFKGNSFMKRNKEYINFEKQKIDLNVESATLYFENIFGDNEELTVQTNKIINDNIKDIVDELKPVIGEIISKFIANIVEGIFNRYSLNELFPN